MNKNIFSIKDEWILIFAFRYALGRRSVAPSIVADMIKGKWAYLTSSGKDQIQREIREAIERKEAGDNCDVETWKTILYLR